MAFSLDRDLRIHEAIEALYPEIEGSAIYFRNPTSISPSIPRPHGLPAGTDNDRAFCALAIRAATTKHSLLQLAQSGDGDSAMILARTILENAILMAWMLQGDGRVRLETYILFGAVLSERLVEIVEKYYSDNEALLALAQSKIDPFARAIARNVFSGKQDTWAYFPGTNAGTLKRITIKAMFLELSDDKTKSFSYDLPYFRGSQFVHSGPLTLLSILPRITARQMFLVSPMPSDALAAEALSISNVAMLLVIKAISDYVGLRLDPKIEEIMIMIKNAGEA